MARTTTYGFEITDASDWALTSGSPTIQGTTVRTGSYAGQITGLVSATRMGWLQTYNSANLTSAQYFKFNFRYHTLPSAENTIFCNVKNATISSPIACRITIDSGGLLRLYQDGLTQVGSASSSLTVDTWYRVEVHIDASAAGGSQLLDARINGTQFAGATNLTLANSYRSMIFGGNLNAEAQTTGSWFFDDIALNDATGSFQNTYVGDESVYTLWPSGVGDSSNFATFGIGNTVNWNAVGTTYDKTIPDNGTTYVSSNNNNDTDMYTCEASPAAINSNSIINAIQVWVRSSSAGASSASFRTQIETSPNSTKTQGSPITPVNGTWATNQGAGNPGITLYQAPDGSSLIKTGIDNMQVGVKLTTPATSAAQISALWVTIGWTQSTTTNRQSLSLSDVGS